LLICYCCCCCSYCCWGFSCWHRATTPPFDVVPLLPVAASGLGCLVMGGIMILSFGHWILWTRTAARVATSVDAKSAPRAKHTASRKKLA
jgi:hypothetical protein